MLEDSIKEALRTLTSAAVLALISIVVVLLRQVAAEAVVFLRRQSELVKSKMTTEQQAVYEWIVANVIKAIEQSDLKGVLTLTAASKKAKAVRDIQSWITKLQLPELDGQQIADLIESAIIDGVHHGGALLVVKEEYIPDFTAKEDGLDAVTKILG